MLKMKNLLMRTGLMMTIFFALATISSGQNSEPGPVVQRPVYFDVSPPLRDMAKKFPGKADNSWKDGIVKNMFNVRKKPPVTIPAGQFDPFLQSVDGMLITDTTIQNFEGNSNTQGYVPPDTHGDVGPNHYFQVVNCHYSIYSKTGTLLLGPLANSSVFTGLPNNSNDGDAVVIYDEQADRWLFSQFSLPNYPNGPFYQMIAVSATGDPTGTWYRYQYTFDNMPDYPKFGVWPDGYYMSANQFTPSPQSWAGCLAAAYDRAAMLAGSSSSSMITFTKPSTNEAFSWLPSDCDGAFPTGSPPNYFVYMYDGSSTDHLGLYEFHVDWTTPANSTFTNFLSLPVAAFTTSVNGIDQPSTTVNLDPINDRLMYRLQYRKFSGYESMVCNHTVDISSSVAGIRWYELRKTTGSWSIYQQGTYAPSDGNSRWMASAAMDGNGNIALGYSVSGPGLYPSIRYTGRKNGDPLNTMTIAEKGICTGTGAQTSGSQRWGDYSSMTCDPSVNGIFWYTNEYLTTTPPSSWKTRIASFRFSNPPVTVTSAATAVTPTSATLNGTVNPNGLATTWYFEWGTTTAYGNTTAVTSAGTGTSTVSVNAGITGLTGGVTYHYRLAATNSDGTSYGADMTFTYGAAVVTTAAALSITGTSAVSGGNVTSDGGYAVTARGVCWGTSANPTISGNHTTDGSGTGTFSSTITGLSANTQYHVRSYATNSVGTFYGDDLTFTTLCGVSSIPLSENFNGATIPSCWTQQASAGASSSWSVSSTANAGGTTNEMKSSYQNVDPGVTRLVTIPINTVGVGQLNLSFRHMLDAYTTGATLSVQSSTDGTNWTTESWTVATTSSNISATLVNTVINNNLNSATTYVAFTVSGNLFNYDYWYIDNVQITGCASYLPVSVSIAASANPICSGSAVTFTATPVNGGASPAYQWKKNTVNISGATNATYSYIPANGDAITCVLTSNATCISGNPASSNAITMTVNPVLPVSVSIGASATTVCAGTSVTFTATPVNGGASPAYQWKKNTVNISGASNSTYSYTPTNGDVITCVLTSNATCITGNPATSNTILMNVNPLLPVNVSIDASATTVCTGTSVTFTATPVNGGASPAYQWKKNTVNISGATNATYSYIPANGDAITCVLTSNATCITGNPATSNTILMNVNPLLPVSVSIGASENPVCAGTEVTFTATPVNGGASPAYQWTINSFSMPGATNSTYSYAPTAGDFITCELTSNATCITGNPATSNTILMNVNPLLPVSVSIGASENPVCAGTEVTFTATPVNGGTSPSYQWQVNGINAGTDSPVFTYTPVNGDQIMVQCQSSIVNCLSGNPATSNTITMTVDQMLPVSVSIVASANPVCAGTEITFTATPVNGGASPSYQWQVNGINSGTDSPLFTYIPADGDQIIVNCQSSIGNCVSGNPATSNTITMTVDQMLPVSVSIVASATTVCEGSLVEFTATPVNGGASPSYQWQVNGINTGTDSPVFMYIPANGDQIMVQCQSSIGNCVSGNPATSNTITMTVDQLLPVSVSIVASANPVCHGSLVDFTATPVNGGPNPVFTWVVNGIPAGADSPQFSYVPDNFDVVACYLTSDAACVTGNPAISNMISMAVHTVPLPVIVSSSDPLDIVCPNSGGHQYFTTPDWSDYTWNIQGPGNTTISSGQHTSAITAFWGGPAGTMGTLHLVVKDQLGCEGTSLTKTISIGPDFTAGSVGNSQTIVAGGTPDPLTASTPTGPGSYTFQWQSSADGTLFINIAGATGLTYTPDPLFTSTWFRQLQTAVEGCVTKPTNDLKINVLQIQGTVSLQPDLTRCAGDTLHVPVHLNGNDLYSLELFITYDHTLLNLHPIRYTNVYPSFAVTAFNATYDPNTLRIVVEQTGFYGVDFSGQKMLDLVFTMTAPGSTTLHLRTTPDAVPVCSLWDSFGNEIFPVTYLDNQINVNPQFIAGTVAADQTIDYNTVPDPLTATPPTTGVPPYTYQWQTSVDGLTFVNIFGETGLTYAPGALTLTTWYRQIQSSSGNCGSLPTNVVVITVNPQPYITITSPNGGEEWTQGSTQTITWNDNIPEDVKIELYKSGLFLQTISPSAASTGSFVWNIPADQLPGSDYKVKITSTTDPALFDYSNAEFTIAPTVPPIRIVQNVTVGAGEIFCYDATTTILVAGGGTTFLVQNGGSANFIAGQNILFLPGVMVEPGGYLHGLITTIGQYCGTQAPSMVSTITGEEEEIAISSPGFIIYPNPAATILTIEQTGKNLPQKAQALFFNLQGKKVMEVPITEVRTKVSLETLPPGLLMVKIISGDQSVIIKLVKN